MNDMVLRTDQLRCGYGSIEIVRPTSIEVRAGTIVALLGANGAGKTTVMSTVSGFIPSLGGTIEYFNTEVLARSTRQQVRHLVRLGVGVVPDDRALFPSMTVNEHLLLAGDRSAAEVVYEQLSGLRPLRSRLAGQLSGGEQQMLAIGRALAARPRLLLIDELSTGLAPMISAHLLEVLASLAESGLGILLVEQHVSEALRVADHAYVLRRGEVVISESAATLREHPEQLAAAYLTAG